MSKKYSAMKTVWSHVCCQLELTKVSFLVDTENCNDCSLLDMPQNQPTYDCQLEDGSARFEGQW